MEKCEYCQHDHETQTCDVEICQQCFQEIDNCDCTPADETTVGDLLSNGYSLFFLLQCQNDTGTELDWCDHMPGCECLDCVDCLEENE